ncbi:MAG TPA: transcriptional regulator [Arenimonas sp.]|nr:transcriptional regulator [Arenimonas sp.]
MPDVRFRFGEFLLDAGSRSLLRDGVPVALNARYFDALCLLLREQGQMVGKQRFFDEVWAGSVVTDAALTQCIKEIRRQLGDDANAPRFVRTVAGRGYCFIAEVTVEAPGDAINGGAELSVGEARRATAAASLPVWWSDVLAATAGGGLAGLVGGLLYGSLLAFAPQAGGLGSLSVLLVLLALSVLVGMAGAFGVGTGMALGRRFGGSTVLVLAGATAGGLLIGGVTRLLGSDVFTLLVGHAPAGITGGLEGAAIGFSLAAGWLAGGGFDVPRGHRPVQLAALCTGLAGALVSLAGGRMMAGSLAQVTATFEQSRLDLAPLAALFGEAQFGPLAQTALGALEGAVFGGCVAAVLLAARRRQPAAAA